MLKKSKKRTEICGIKAGGKINDDLCEGILLPGG